MNYNRTIIGGRLTRDPELRVTPKGTAICQFSVAVSRQFKDDSGGEREEVAFIDCEAWAKTGEAISKFFSKGKAILIEGRLKQDSWEDKETKAKRTKLKVVVDSFQFVGPKEGGSAQQQAPARPASQEQSDEDVPF